jgi:hypothetical protein
MRDWVSPTIIPTTIGRNRHGPGRSALTMGHTVFTRDHWQRAIRRGNRGERLVLPCKSKRLITLFENQTCPSLGGGLLKE